jgi:N-acetyl-anhydromuramyl-L-alanine amidase AmpD
MRSISEIIVHCSKHGPDSDSIGVKAIDRMHRAKCYLEVGYHYVIKRDGSLEEGRPLERPGLHASGHDKDSIGICLVGGVSEHGHPHDNFTAQQLLTLWVLLKGLQSHHPNATIIGHREVDSGNFCPSFDVQKFLKERDPK